MNLIVLLAFLVGLAIILARHYQKINKHLSIIETLEENIPQQEKSEIFTHKSLIQTKGKQKLFGRLAGFFVIILLFILIFRISITSAFVSAILLISLTILIYNNLQRMALKKKIQATHAILPAIVERIVMAVHAGLDIIPAIERIVQLEHKECKRLARKPDPVSLILENVLNRYYSGARLEEALEEHARASNSTAIRHTFIHLAIAHREGGELIMPLRELSDATQLMYQEEVEEAINTLPVRATIPLVLTFAGLILCFLATPVIQVLNISQQQSQELSHGPN